MSKLNKCMGMTGSSIGFLMNYSAVHRNINSYSDLVYGWELIIYDYSMRLIKEGYTVYWLIYSDGSLSICQEFDGIKLIRLSKWKDSHNPIEGILLIAKLISVIKGKNLKVLYTRATFLGFYTSFICRVLRIPFVFHVEDLETSIIKSSGQTAIVFMVAMMELFYQKNACILSRKILTVSRTFKRFLISNWGMPAKKIQVLYEGVEIPKPVAGGKKHNDTKSEATKILYIGGTTAYDGIDTLITAFDIINKNTEKPQRIELIIGTFSSEANVVRLKELAKRLNFSNIKFFTSITGQLARDLANSCDIAVIPRRRTLSTELTTTSVIFLYISETIPVIAPKLPAIVELVGDGALFFEPESPESLSQHLLKLIHDEEYRLLIKDRLLLLQITLSRQIMCEELTKTINYLTTQKTSSHY